MSCRRIVITTDNDTGLRSAICRDFGKSPYYVIATLDRGEIVNVTTAVNERFRGHQLGLLQTVWRCGASLLLAGGMEPHVRSMFNDLGVDVICDLKGTASEVLENWLRPNDLHRGGRISSGGIFLPA